MPRRDSHGAAYNPVSSSEVKKMSRVVAGGACGHLSTDRLHRGSLIGERGRRAACHKLRKIALESLTKTIAERPASGFKQDRQEEETMNDER
jgi:hypothetical protein